MNTTSLLYLRLPLLQSIFWTTILNQKLCFTSKFSRGLFSSHQSSQQYEFNKYSSFFPATQMYFGEVPRTQHRRQHSLRLCMDFFSLYALANKSVHTYFCQQSAKHKVGRYCTNNIPLFGRFLKKWNTSKDR